MTRAYGNKQEASQRFDLASKADRDYVLLLSALALSTTIMSLTVALVIGVGISKQAAFDLGPNYCLATYSVSLAELLLVLNHELSSIKMPKSAMVRFKNYWKCDDLASQDPKGYDLDELSLADYGSAIKELLMTVQSHSPSPLRKARPWGLSVRQVRQASHLVPSIPTVSHWPGWNS